MLGLGIVAFLVAIVMFAVDRSPQLPQEQEGSRSTAFEIQAYGDKAVQELAADWSESALAKCFAPDLYSQPIYMRMASRLTDLKESLGELVSVQSSVSRAPKVKGDYLEKFEYRAKGTFKKGNALIHMAIYGGDNMIEILGVDIDVVGAKDAEQPSLDLPKGDSGKSGTGEKPDPKLPGSNPEDANGESTTKPTTTPPATGSSQL